LVLSQCFAEGIVTTDTDARGRGWTISMGDGFQFEITRLTSSVLRPFSSDADLNGLFPTKLEACEEIIASFEATRAALGRQIARAKRMRARLIAQESIA
jgi:hypothetical protein